MLFDDEVPPLKKEALCKNWFDALPEDWRDLIRERNTIIEHLEKQAAELEANVTISLPPSPGLEYFFPKEARVAERLYNDLVSASKNLESSVEDEYKWFLLLRFGRRLESTGQFRHLAQLKETEPEKWLMNLTAAAMAVSELQKSKLGKLH